MWPLDRPEYIVIIGIVLGVIIGGLWTASGRKELLFGLVAVALFTTIWLVVERLVVTDQEAIRATLYEIARDVQSNDVQRVTRHVAKSNQSLVTRAKNELPNYDFEECRVTKVHLTDVDAGAEPRSAVVEFNVVATGTFRQGSIEISDTVPRWIQLQMVREEDGKWRVQNYRHDAPQQFLFGQPLSDYDR
jgi:hypothetical protein